MKVPLLDLKAQYQSIKRAVDDNIAEVMESQYFIMGPKVSSCEDALNDYTGSAYSVGVSSGTDALLLSLMAEGIGPGDEVITSPYTFFSTGGSVARLGAKPVFVDIDKDSFNICPRNIEEKITERTKAIIPVHLYGQLADIEPILHLAKKYGLLVIEDAAQALGARNGDRHAGTFGDYGCFSFFPSKNLGGAGDGGLITTQSEEKYQKLKKLRVHGSSPKYYHSMIGGNFRLDAIQAAVIGAKLPHLENWIDKRRANAKTYKSLFEAKNLVNNGSVRLPMEIHGRHSYNQFVIITGESQRDALREYLKSADVGTEIYYPVPLHLQECFRDLGYEENSMPVSEINAKSSLAIPIYPELTLEQQEYVVDTIDEYFQSK